MAEQVTTVEEWDALPTGSVVLTDPPCNELSGPESPYDCVYQSVGEYGWLVAGAGAPVETREAAGNGPGTVLFRPDRPVGAVTREQVEAAAAQLRACEGLHFVPFDQLSDRIRGEYPRRVRSVLAALCIQVVEE